MQIKDSKYLTIFNACLQMDKTHDKETFFSEYGIKIIGLLNMKMWS